MCYQAHEFSYNGRQMTLTQLEKASPCGSDGIMKLKFVEPDTEVELASRG
jgi:hypothetical protein